MAVTAEATDDSAMQEELRLASTTSLSGWPVIEPGLVMVSLNHVQVVLHDSIDERRYERFVLETGRIIDSYSDDVRVLTLSAYRDGPWWKTMSISERTDYM